MKSILTVSYFLFLGISCLNAQENKFQFGMLIDYESGRVGPKDKKSAVLETLVDYQAMGIGFIIGKEINSNWSVSIEPKFSKSSYIFTSNLGAARFEVENSVESTFPIFLNYSKLFGKIKSNISIGYSFNTVESTRIVDAPDLIYLRYVSQFHHSVSARLSFPVLIDKINISPFVGFEHSLDQVASEITFLSIEQNKYRKKALHLGIKVYGLVPIFGKPFRESVKVVSHKIIKAIDGLNQVPKN